MLSKDKILQNSFLQTVVQEKAPVTVFLVNGVKLEGVIAGFDHFVIFLCRDSQMQMVYKHAVSTLLPLAGLNFRKALE